MTARRLAIFAGAALLGTRGRFAESGTGPSWFCSTRAPRVSGRSLGRKAEGGPLYLRPEEIFASDGQLRPDWLTPRALSLLAEKLERARSLARAQSNSPCLPYQGPIVDAVLPRRENEHPREHSASERRIAAREVILAARIVKVAPGFRLATLSPTNLITMQLERIFRDRSSLSLTQVPFSSMRPWGGPFRSEPHNCARLIPANSFQGLETACLSQDVIDPRRPEIIYPNEPEGVLVIRADDMVVIRSPTPDGAPELLPLTSVPQSLDLLTADQRSESRHE
jgi:hypothetical protein